MPRSRSSFILVVLLALAIVLPSSGVASGSDRVLVLTGPVAAEEVFDGWVAGFRDPGGQMSVTDAKVADFRPVDGQSLDFGYTTDALWARLVLRNATAENRDWRLHFRSNFLPEFAVWLVEDGAGARLLEDQRPESSFHSRALPYPELTVPFVLAPGATGEIYIRYRSGGASNLSFAIQSADSFAALASRKTARNFTFYGMMLLLTGAAFLASILTRRAIFLAYGCYACVAVLFVMHADGNTFQYLWPDAPAFNAYASVLLGAGLIVFGANFARMFLRTGVFHPVLNRMLIGLIGLALAMVAVTAIGFTQEIKKLLVLTAFLSTILFTVAGLVAARTRFREVRFYVVAWVGAVIASAIMTGRHWLGIEISEELQFDAMRVVMVTDAVMMGLAILDSVNQMRQAQRRTLELALAETRRNLDLSRRLNQLEENHAMTLALAQSNERRLADTAHDLRQPIAALRLNVERLLAGASERGDSQRTKDFEDSFNYLEDLVAGELARQGGDGAGLPTADDGQRQRPYPVEDVLGAVAQMFRPTAEERGIALRHVPSSARTTLPPLVLMRVASNLLSNAIRYTDAGAVLIGVRRAGGSLRLEVHDTGPGMSAAAFEAARGRSVQLANAGDEGAGLGLAIIDDLARRHGLEVRLCTRRRGGTGMTVRLPSG